MENSSTEAFTFLLCSYSLNAISRGAMLENSKYQRIPKIPYIRTLIVEQYKFHNALAFIRLALWHLILAL